MVKRLFDIVVSIIGLIVTAPIWGTFALIIYFQDFHWPFYIAPRVGLRGRMFKMMKLRSMIVNADKSGVDSTSNSDNRITKVGHIVRRFKIDELPQLFNVLAGDMSMVGPRPQVKRGTDVYTDEEMHILDVRPGITDLASIVFSDEGSILSDKADPDDAYDKLIRPWKSRLCLLYVREHNLVLDMQIILLTALALVEKPLALRYVARILDEMNADEKLKTIAKRAIPLYSIPPPMHNEILRSHV